MGGMAPPILSQEKIMNMLVVVSVTDSFRHQIDDKLSRINEINTTIEKLKHEAYMLAIDVDHGCNLLEAVIEDKDYKENIVESVIDSHKSFIKRCRSIVNTIREDDRKRNSCD